MSSLLCNSKNLSFYRKAIFPMLFASGILFTQSGCKKLVDVSPPVTGITGASVYTTDANAIATLTGLYAKMVSLISFSDGFISLSLYPALSADELSVYGASNATFSQYYTNNLSSSTNGNVCWTYAYQMMFTINSAIIGIDASNSLTPSIKRQLLGEAKFMRAFCYFYLVNIYGDVPLVTGIDYNTNSTLSRTEQVRVYQQIIEDLKDAQGLLSAKYMDGYLLNTTTERVRPTKWSAAALLARIYLYTNDWANAEKQSDSVIRMQPLYKLDSLGGVFLKNGPEAIWQLQPVLANGFNTQIANFFILPASGPGTSFPVYLNNILVNSFEVGDKRVQSWMGNVKIAGGGLGYTFYYAKKYKINTLTTPVKEYTTVLRLGEQYLIRAEAKAQQNKLADAVSDLDTIRTRSGLPTIANIVNTTLKSDLLGAIYHERQVELFTEWGHRWFDLKRTGLVDLTMNSVAPQKGGVWLSYKKLYPIPVSEIKNDPNLKQNDGY